MRKPTLKYRGLVVVALLLSASVAYSDQGTGTFRPTSSDPVTRRAGYTGSDRFTTHEGTIIAIAACYDFSNETRPSESPCFTFSTLPLPQLCLVPAAKSRGPLESGDDTVENDGGLAAGGRFEIAATPNASATRVVNLGQFDATVPQGNTTPRALAKSAEISLLSPNPAAGSTQSLSVIPSAAPSASPNATRATAHYEGAKWSNGSVITWSIADRPATATSPFSGYMGAQYEALVQQAFQTWSAASGLTFEEVADSSQSDIRLGWDKFDTRSTGVVGYTAYEMESGKLQPGVIIRIEDPSQVSLVAGTSFALTYSGTDANLSQVLLHEIGHALGLADNDDPNSVMHYRATGLNNTLDDNDVAGIRTLYGSPALAAQGLQAAASELSGTPKNSITR